MTRICYNSSAVLNLVPLFIPELDRTSQTLSCSSLSQGLFKLAFSIACSFLASFDARLVALQACPEKVN